MDSMTTTLQGQQDSPVPAAVLQDPIRNKGTAFTEVERDRLGLRGLLPPHVHTLEDQLLRVRGGLEQQKDDLQKYVFLSRRISSQ